MTRPWSILQHVAWERPGLIAAKHMREVCEPISDAWIWESVVVVK
jgi:hypothetical protein